jgi:hypothetical protein
MLGLFGTAFGLSLQAKALAGGGAKPLNCTACGVLAAALVAVMTFNLEAGIRRARNTGPRRGLTGSACERDALSRSRAKRAPVVRVGLDG